MRRALLGKTGLLPALRRAYTCPGQLNSKDLIARDEKYGGNHFKTLPVMIERGEGIFVWDVEGKRYFDMLAGFAVLSQGHCHPRIVAAMQQQACTLAHTSRAFYSRWQGELCEYITKLTGYDRFLPMNTGVEADDTALKIARKWGYTVKKIPHNKAEVVFCTNGFWGRSLAALSASKADEKGLCKDFGPCMPGFEVIPYDDLCALDKKLCNCPNVCAFLMEPVQGEAGVIIPSEGYLRGVRELCTKYNVLWIADEVQTGLGRTGRRLATDHECVKPDLTTLGKALSGGMYPVSGILGGDELIRTLTQGSHGSTFGGSPLGQRVALEALRVIEEECLADNAARLECVIRSEFGKLPKEMVCDVRVRGLMGGIQLNPNFANGWDICHKLIKAGVITRVAHDYTLRILPPLIITEEQLREAICIIIKVLIEHKPGKGC